MRVAIIGAGICGLYLGWKLSKKGHRVLIFEKRGEIGKDACSGLFSQRILKFIPGSSGLIRNKINSVVIHFLKKTIKVKFSKEFFVMSHFELDKLIASFAKKAGSEIILNREIASLPDNFDRIIGCDGPRSFIRKELGLPQPNFRLAIQGFTPHSFSRKSGEGFVETWPYRNDGFVWKIPRGQEIEYGIIARPNEAKQLFEKFLTKNNLQLREVKAGMVPQGLILPNHPSITLCGDAAGLTKPWSGGGVIWGLTAAEILLRYFPDFSKYRKAMKRFFLPEIIFSKLAAEIIYFLGFNIPWILPSKMRIDGDYILTHADIRY